MRKKESINLLQYLIKVEERLEQTKNDCEYRFVRRDLDSIDLLEEIIAKENLRFFKAITHDILHILNMCEDD